MAQIAKVNKVKAAEYARCTQTYAQRTPSLASTRGVRAGQNSPAVDDPTVFLTLSPQYNRHNTTCSCRPTPSIPKDRWFLEL
ncbi:unnamed protein product [Lactuca virosa]|uniref:Uncharacterized protein n=1 Tax=Lactuca virosa TaxID=75947 RepID=A0AAU9PT00_9ASTR|nr:unnamed protein product [Lactuca virosa]